MKLTAFGVSAGLATLAGGLLVGRYLGTDERAIERSGTRVVPG